MRIDAIFRSAHAIREARQRRYSQQRAGDSDQEALRRLKNSVWSIGIPVEIEIVCLPFPVTFFRAFIGLFA